MGDKYLIKNGAVVEGFSMGSTLFDIQGTQGQLFSVTDSLYGDIFSVSDITGMPILNVNSNGTVSIDGTLSLLGTIYATQLYGSGIGLTGVWKSSGNWMPTVLSSSSSRLIGITSPDGQGEFGLAYSSGIVHAYVDGFFYQNEGQYKVVDWSSVTSSVTANAIVQRDASGYVYGNYFNSTRGDETTAAASYVFDTGDGWMRKKPLSYVRSEIVTSGAITSALGYNVAKSVSIGQSNIDAWLGDGFFEFDPIPTGTPPLQSPNIRVLSIGASARNTQMAFDYNTDRSFFRRRLESTWYPWVEYYHTGNLTPSNYATHRGEGTNYIDYSYGLYDAYRGGWRTSNDLYVAYAYNSNQAAIVRQDPTGSNVADLVYSMMADNDYFRLRVGGTATNAGYVEFATADDGTEPIYFRQYSGAFTSIVRTLTLLDNNGNSSFPGHIYGSGNLYLNSNYGNTIVGAYDASKIQGVYAMGQAYMLPADGSNSGNLYGMAWSHPNAGGQASNLSSHGLLLMQNGVTMAALSTNIWCSGQFNGNGAGLTGTASNLSVNYATTANKLNGAAHTNGSDGWWRSDGSCGWYNESYGVGIYATEAGNVRTYNGANFISSGNITAVGEITAYSSSDERLKENIKPLNQSLELINKLNPVSYNWNEKAKELNPNKDDKKDVGVIAQELEKVLPNLVHNIYNDEFLAVDYVKLIPYLIGAIQELTDKINKLENNK